MMATEVKCAKCGKPCIGGSITWTYGTPRTECLECSPLKITVSSSPAPPIVLPVIWWSY